MKEFHNLYLEADKELRLKRSIAGCLLSIILFPAGIVLDFFIYPEFLREFSALRIMCSALTFIILAAHYNKYLKNYTKSLTFLWMVLAQAIMCYMIFITEGYESTYYAGLNLTILGTGVLLPLSVLEVFAFCLVTVFLYIFSSHVGNINDIGLLFNNLYFISLTSVISITASHFNSKYRYKEFCLNYDLKEAVKNLRSTTDQLIQSEKINAIGSLSAGLLHEVNNPLNYTMTALQVMKMDPHVSSDEDLKDTMKDIEEGMNRIKHIVTDLRAFAYPEEVDKRNQFPVLSAVENALRFTASESQNIEKITDIDESLIVSASKTHVVQVLINLVSNAARAITKSNKKEGVIKVSAKQENDRVIITVSDNGTGMSEETLKKVFDPFFTTNEVGKGMGLGLSVSHTIVRNHGGNLTVSSKLGEGSVFRFDLGV
jgi:two-component system, sensor histidine kinase PhcS